MAHTAQLSARALAMPASPIRRLAPLADQARRAGKHVHALNIGQPDTPTPAAMLERMHRWAEPNVAYGPSGGLSEFVEAIRRYHARWGLALAADEIFVTTGGSEALLFIIGAVTDPGDELLVFEPFYTNYSGFAQLVGARTVAVTTRAEDGYHLPPAEAIEARLSPRTRAILLCSPNNPTGTVYGAEELERVGRICRERGLFLIADEAYREFTYDGLRHRSAMALPGLEQQVVLADSLSKRVSLCGARVGWIASRNPSLMQAVLRFGQARLCPPTLGQHMGALLDAVGEEYTQAILAEYQRRRDRVYTALSSMQGVRVRKPEGAFYLCAGLPIDDAQRFAEFLLRDFSLDGETVMLAPADGFYATEGLGRDEVRLAYVVREELLVRCMAILEAALEAYPGRRVSRP
jgi:aspartate aminotransferase